MSVHKGLDDLLAAGGKPQRLTDAAVDAFFASVRAVCTPRKANRHRSWRKFVPLRQMSPGRPSP